MADIFDLFRKIEKGTAAPKGPVTHLVVGLGNPGAQYATTRHNAGFLALDFFAERLCVQIDRARFKGLTAEAELGGKHVLLLKPQTFTNLSGEAVREAASFYHVDPANIIVLYDDINLAVGRLRVRGKGSDGGHNGIKSIIAQLGSNAFPRVRIGVGERPHPDFDLADWVLSSFTGAEREGLQQVFVHALEGTELLLQGDVPAAQQRCNGVCVC